MAEESHALRTPSGAPTAYAREKYGYKDTGRFPIFDKKSAKAALQLIGHAHSADEKAWIRRQAAKYGEHSASD
jgi:hypothetical protein